MGIVLFEKKSDCCACGACLNVCPKGAITMKADECGFLYPEIDTSKCIECGACKKVCAFQNNSPELSPIKVFAAANADREQLLVSASGGVFSAVATKVLSQGGIVYGATLEIKDGSADVYHRAIETIEDLPLLQGSKYVQSSIGGTYKEAKAHLIAKKLVLFSGTPCQIAGLYGYLGKDYDNLITAELVCHGVPNVKFFNDYLQCEKEKRNAKEVCGYSFRDTKKGWARKNGRIDLKFSDSKVKSFYMPPRLNSYNTMFLDRDICRENCYGCKYAGNKRGADLTMGDFWGVETEQPELLRKEGYDEKSGISCLLVNTEKGVRLCETLDNLHHEPSSFEKVSKKNGQLKSASVMTPKREKILSLYSREGYGAVEKLFREKYKKQIIIHTIYAIMPLWLRSKLKSVSKG